MLVTDFDFDCPDDLIARYPAEKRTESRLLCLPRYEGEAQDKKFTDLFHLLKAGDCLVLNHSRVMPALIWGEKSTGGKIECLIERVLGEEVLAHVRASKAPKVGQYLLFPEGLRFQVIEKSNEGLYRMRVKGVSDIYRYLIEYGNIPLPPYMKRRAEKTDESRYQTVYSSPLGSVAAPTAGLHFDEAFLNQLKIKGVRIAKVTLHVGAGTFQPVRVSNITDHHMHAEWIQLDKAACCTILRTKEEGGRVVAVGTTAVRVLESIIQKIGKLEPYEGETSIFIYPGFKFQIVDALLTNFHLPQSTLLMLVSAFAGRERILQAYLHAKEAQYRFFSYGDAMFIA